MIIDDEQVHVPVTETFNFPTGSPTAGREKELKYRKPTLIRVAPGLAKCAKRVSRCNHSKTHGSKPSCLVSVVAVLVSLPSLSLAQNLDLDFEARGYSVASQTTSRFAQQSPTSASPTKVNTTVPTAEPSRMPFSERPSNAEQSLNSSGTPSLTKGSMSPSPSLTEGSMSPSPSLTEGSMSPSPSWTDGSMSPSPSLTEGSMSPSLSPSLNSSYPLTISPDPTLAPTTRPTSTPSPSGVPSLSPIELPSPSPSWTPSVAPTFENVSYGYTYLLQSFKVGNGRIFNDSEQFHFEEVMKGYTYNISGGIDLSNVNATCSVKLQRLLIDPERRRYLDQLRVLQDVVTSSNATNQVEYTMEWASYHVNVTEYPSLFSKFVEANLANLTLDLQEVGLDVLSSSPLRAVIVTEAPSVSPTESFKPSPNPSKEISFEPSTTPIYFETLEPSLEGYEPSIAPTNKPSNRGSGVIAGVDTNTIVIASVLVGSAIVTFCGVLFFYRRRREIREMEFKAAAAAFMSSENEIGEASVDHNREAVENTGNRYDDGHRSDDEYGVVSPNESLVSNPSLVSTGISLGEHSMDEADKTHNLADAFDQYKDQNLEKVRADVEEVVIGSDSMMNQAMTLAFMGDDEIFGETRDLIAGAGADSTEIEADLLCEANDFLKRNDFADIEERKNFLQEITNKVVAYVLHGVISADDASRIIHESAAMLGLELAAEIPENTVVVSGLRKNVTNAHLESTFREFGELDKVAIASGARGFGLVRFLSTQSALRTLTAFREGEIVVQDVGVTVKVLKSEVADQIV